MIVRKMKIEDVPSIEQLERLCFSDPWSAKSITSEVSNPLSYWLVAEEDGCIVGYVGSQSVLDSADIMNLAVSPQYRRRGIGKLLVDSLSHYLSENNVNFLLLEVRVSNVPAISLYKKIGFEQVGRRPRYYRNPVEDALILRKDLLK